MVNSGSIVVNALLQNLMQPDMSGAEKFDYLNDYIKVMNQLLPSELIYLWTMAKLGKFANAVHI